MVIRIKGGRLQQRSKIAVLLGLSSKELLIYHDEWTINPIVQSLL